MLSFLRLILAGVFALAGVTKLLDLPGSRQSLQDFGVSTSLIPILAFALPLAELATAAALLPQASALYGAAAAVVLLAGFSGAVGLSLLLGRRPACHCFGQLHSQPVGRQVLARNGALLVIAVLVIVQEWPDGGAGPYGWFLPPPPGLRVVAAGVVIGLTALAVRVVRRTRTSGKAPRVPEWTSFGLPVGAPAPEFSLAGLDGELVTLSTLRARGKPVVLIFSDPHCGSCSTLLPDIAQWQAEYAEDMLIAVVSRDTPDANRSSIGGLAIGHVLLQKDREVSAALGVPFTPGAVMIHTDGSIGSPPAPGDAAVRKLVAEVAASRNVAGPEGGVAWRKQGLAAADAHVLDDRLPFNQAHGD